MHNVLRPDLPEKLEVMPIARRTLGVDLADVVNCPAEKYISETLWTCSICRGIPRKPIMLRTCTHVGCEPCLMEYITAKLRSDDESIEQDGTPCPLCRTPYTDNDLVPYEKWPLLCKAVFEGIKIKCPKTIINLEVECNFVGSITEFVNHEQFVCERRWISCPNRGCSFQNIAKTVKEHFDQCNKLSVYCSACRLPVKWYMRESHRCIADMQIVLQSMSEACRGVGVRVDKVLGNIG